MNRLVTKHRFWLRLTSLFVACLFIINEASFASGSLDRGGKDKLSPVSRLSPLADLKDDGGSLTVEERPANGTFEILKAFRDEAVFMYLSEKIGATLIRFGSGIAPEALATILEREIPGRDILRFDVDGLYAENGSFCLPYHKTPDEVPYILRYYLPDSVFAGSRGEISIKVGSGEVRVLCESPRSGERSPYKKSKALPAASAEAAVRGLLEKEKGKTIIVPACQSNIVRSPQMELVLRKLIRQNGMQDTVGVISGGIRLGKLFGDKLPGLVPYAAMTGLGLMEDAEYMDRNFYNKPVTRELAAAADLIIVSNFAYKLDLISKFPDVQGIYEKVITYGDLRARLGAPKKDLADEIDIPGVYETISGNFSYLVDRAKRHKISIARPGTGTKPLADGSPHSVYCMLKDELREWATIEDIRLLTEGRMSDGHLGDETVERDLGALITLGLVMKVGAGEGVVYKANPELSPDEWGKIDPILRALGTRPSSSEISDAAGRIAALMMDEAVPAVPSRSGGFVEDNTVRAATVNAGSIVKPLEAIRPEEVKNILVFNLQRYYSNLDPKLGEMIIDLWPVVTELWKKFPDATIHLAAPYPDIFEAKQFEGRIVSVDPEALRGEEGRIKYIGDTDLDMIVEVSPVPRTFESALKKIYPEPGAAAAILGRPYHMGIVSPSAMTGATNKTMLHDLSSPFFVDREGREYEVEGIKELAPEISQEGFAMEGGRMKVKLQMKHAGSWNYSIGACRMMGLDVTAKNLCNIELGLEEAVAALKWLESCHNAAGGRSFDPTRKIIVVNVYAVTQGKLISEEDWVDVIYEVMNTVEDAYFVFTHGGIMDRDFQYVNDIIRGVQEKIAAGKMSDQGKNEKPRRNEIILPKVQEIYPHINNLLGVASAVISLDTGFSHLANGVYGVPTGIITHSDIVQWMPPRDTAEGVVLPNVTIDDMMQLAAFSPGAYMEANAKHGEHKKEILARGIRALAEKVNRRSEWPSARMAKIAALSTRMRATLDKRLLAEPLPISQAVRALVVYGSTAIRGLGMAHLGLIPRIVVVDSAKQIGIGIPRFKFKLYVAEDGETYLLIDKSAFDVQGAAADIERAADFLHEIIGHRLVRMLFPEFMEANIEALRSGDGKNILLAKTTEEVLACLVTIMAIERLGPITAELTREEERERFLLICPAMGELTAEARITAIMDGLLVRDQRIKGYWYKEIVQKRYETIKNVAMSAYMPVIEKFFGERDGASENNTGGPEEFFDIQGRQFSLRALGISDSYKTLEAYDADGRKAAYVFAQYRRGPLAAPEGDDENKDGFADKMGIRGLRAFDNRNGPELALRLLGIFLEKNPDVNLIHRTSWDPMLLILAQERFGFDAVAPDAPNAVYVRTWPGPPRKPEIWIPNPQLRLLFLTSRQGAASSDQFEVFATAPEDISSFARVYLNTTYVRPARKEVPAGQQQPLAEAPAGQGMWPLKENSVDMIVSRSSVNFMADDLSEETYNAAPHAVEYGSHGEEDYNRALGLKRKGTISGHIKGWQKAHPGEVFSLLDLGAGKGGLIKDLARGGQEIDGKRLVVTGVNRPEEKDVWARFTDLLIPQCTGLAGASIEYFDFFYGWNAENGVELSVPPGITSRNMRAAYFTKQVLRVLKPGGEAHIQVGALSEEGVTIVSRIVETSGKPGIVNYRRGVLHIGLLEPGWGSSGGDGEPAAIALVMVRGEWKPFKIEPLQHMLINFIWREIWGKGFELPEDDAVVLDLRHSLGRAWDRYPIHVHSPPGDVIYDKMYTKAASVKMNLPPRSDFRLVTHPGTFRDEKGPRSFNLLIPREELVFLKTLRTRNFKAYSRWLDHEVEHLIDRATSKKGLELKEEKVTKASPYDELIAAYNEHRNAAPASAAEELSEIEKQIGRLYESDIFIAADAAVKLGRMSSSREMWRDPTLVRDAISGLLYRASKEEQYSSVEAVRALVLFSEKFELDENVESRMAVMISDKGISAEQKKAIMGFLSPWALTSSDFKADTMHQLLQGLSYPHDPELSEAVIELAGSFDYFKDSMPRSVISHAMSVLAAVALTGRAPFFDNQTPPPLNHDMRRLAIRQMAKIFKQVTERSVAPFIGSREKRVTLRELHETYMGMLSDFLGLVDPAGLYFAEDLVTRRQVVIAIQTISREFFSEEHGAAVRTLGAGKAIRDVASARKKLLEEVARLVSGVVSLEKDPRVKRQMLEVVSEFMYPGFGYFEWILPRIFDVEVPMPSTLGTTVELVVRAIQKSDDPRGMAVLRNLAANSESDLGRQISKALGGQPGEFAANTGAPSGKPRHLQIPSPRRYIPDMDERMGDIVENFCKPAERDPASIVPDERMPWARVNAILLQNGLRTFEKENRPVIHVVDVGGEEEEDGLLGFPLSKDATNFADSVPVVSYMSPEDGKLHIFVTAAFYDDYLEISHMNESIVKARISDMRLAEILDHEDFEHSKEAESYPEEERHHIASARAGYFVPDRQTISCFHKWVIDSLASTEEGREYLVLLLDEYRPSVDAGRKNYETAFYVYAKNVLPRKRYSREVQRLAHHLLRVYSGGDQRAFADICAAAGIKEPKALDKDIQTAEKKHVLNAVKGFQPDITITHTSETTVEIDNQKGIVRKSLKSDYAGFAWDVLMKDPDGQGWFNALFQAGLKDNFMVVYREQASPAVKHIYDLMEKHLDASLIPSKNKGDAVRLLLKDYLDQVVMLNSYLTAQKRLGGLIADFTIIEGRIYQKKVMPLSVYLQHLIAGTGPFAGRKNDPPEIKTRIAEGILEKYLECVKELAKRGAVISNVKLTNFGVTESGEVVLFDLGRSSISWVDEDREAALSNLTMVQMKLAADSKRIADLNGELNSEETGIVGDFADTPAIRKLQEEWAGMWLGLISEREVPEGDIEIDFFLDGEKIVKEISELLPETAEAAEKEYRKITFMPTDMAEEETLQIIMEKVSSARDISAGGAARGLPDGSPARAFEILRSDLGGRWASTEDARVLTKGHAADGHLSTATVMRDISTLISLGLVTVRESEDGGEKEALFRAADLSPPEEAAVNPVLEKLGARPDAKMKAAAREELSRILAAGETVDLPGIKFGTREIPGAYMAVEAFDENGKNVAFLYAQGDENATTEEGARPGIRGIFVDPEYRSRGLAAELMKRLLEKYPDIRILHESVMNPVLRYMAKEHFGFVPRAPEEKNRAYLRLPDKPGGKGEIWIPDKELRADYSLGPEEAMLASILVLKAAPKDLSGFKTVYFNTVYERRTDAKDMPYWGETPADGNPPNPYADERNISRDFTDLNNQYFGEIVPEIMRIHERSPERPVKVLLIGAGRGFEAFELMHDFGSLGVEVTVTSKEDLLYRSGDDLAKRFMANGAYIEPEDATAYIRDLRKRYLRCDLEEGIPLETGAFDIVVVGGGTFDYIRGKLFAVEEMIRVCRDGGSVYCTAKDGYVNTGSGRVTLARYLSSAKDARIRDLDGQGGDWLKISKKDGLALPDLELVEARKDEGMEITVPKWETYYAERRRATKKPARDVRFEGEKEPQGYYKWVARKVLADKRAKNIRPIVPEDASAVRELSRRISVLGPNFMAIDKIANGQSETNADIYVYEDRGKIAGYVYYERKNSGTVLSIEEIAVSPEIEGSGVATLLLGRALKDAMELGASKFETRAKATAGRSAALFRRFGFEPLEKSPPGNAVHYKLSLASREDEEPGETLQDKNEVKKDEENNQEPVQRRIEFPLTPEAVMTLPMGRKEIDLPAMVQLAQQDMAYGMEEGGFLPRIGFVNVPECLDNEKCKVFATGQIMIACFKVDLHIDGEGVESDPMPEEYVLSIMADGKVIGHGIAYKMPGSDAVNFRYSIHGGVPAIADHRRKGYGSEALALIMAMSARGGIFTGPVEEFVFPHRPSDVISDAAISGMMNMVSLLEKAGFDDNLSFSMKGLTAPPGETKVPGPGLVLELALTGKDNKRTRENMQEKINDFILGQEPVLGARSGVAEDALNELAFNANEHGKGGVIRAYIEERGENEGPILRIVSEDKGKGLKRDINELISEGLKSPEERGFRGNGMKRICLDPDRVTVECGGKKFTRITSDPKAGKWFGEPEKSDVTAGSVFTLEFDLEPASKRAKRVAPTTLAEKAQTATRSGPARVFMKEIMIKAASGGKVIIGVDTSWVPGLQEADIESLLVTLQKLQKKKGFDNIVIRRSKGEALAGVIKEEMDRTGTALENVIIIGSEKVLASTKFDDFRKGEKEGKSAFFAGVQLPGDFTETSYTRILEMIIVAIRLASGAAKEEAVFGDVEAIPVGPRSFIFIPLASPMDFEVYKIQTKYIRTSA